ncbi:MAG: LytTR family DNA-binding domain-containing protein, partial [Bacilli bacterium]
EEIIRKNLENIISFYFSKRKIQCEIHIYSSGFELLKENEEVLFSFIFLDIDLGNHSGIDIAKELRKKQITPVNIVFVTSYSEYQTKVMSIHTFDYIMKPLKTENINNVLDDLMFWYNTGEKKESIKFRFKTIDGLITLEKDQILYFEYIDRRITIISTSGIYYMYGKMKDVLKIVSKYNFTSPHVAYIINLNEIEKYLKADNLIIMTDKKKIPISQLKSKLFRNDYMTFISKYGSALGRCFL